MSDVRAFRAMSLAITALVGTAAIVACTIQLRGPGNEMSPTPSRSKASNALESDLGRCRTVTSEQAPTYEHCQRIWAENRRRFFGPRASTEKPAEGDPGGAPSSLPPKDQSRLPQGYPSIATPRG